VRRGVRAAYRLIAPPVQEPITLQQAKDQARITGDDSNATTLSYLKTAREAAEQSLGYGLFTQTWQLALSDFTDRIQLPMAMQLQNDALANPSTAVLVQYYDSLGTLQSLAASNYLVDATARPAEITRAPLKVWPVVQADRLAARILITYVVGWTSPTLIPERIKQGIRSYLTYLDLDRDGMDPNAKGARDAAEACWIDKLYWAPPDTYDLDYRDAWAALGVG
jgi:uncharacterized phiE125 gp8 family phage protein